MNVLILFSDERVLYKMNTKDFVDLKQLRWGGLVEVHRNGAALVLVIFDS